MARMAEGGAGRAEAWARRVRGGGGFLAPMVRCGTLPLRLQALDLGAAAVYSEETIDRRLHGARREWNAAAGTTDFVDAKGVACFRTCAREHERVVLQIGTAEAGNAVRAAELVARDVACIDVNMGCPVHFSVQGGMGAALLKKPEVAADIVKSLRRNLGDMPVTCKIRLLPTARETVEFARAMAAAGAVAVGVHGRLREQRPREPASWAGIRDVAEALDVPVLANGDVFEHADIARVRQATGAAAALVARGAQWNPSIFRPEGFLPQAQVRQDYVRYSRDTENHVANTKYVLREMMKAPKWFKGGGGKGLLESEEGRGLSKCTTMGDLCRLYGVPEVKSTLVAGARVCEEVGSEGREEGTACGWGTSGPSGEGAEPGEVQAEKKRKRGGEDDEGGGEEGGRGTARPTKHGTGSE